MTSVRQIRAENNPSGKYAYEIKAGVCRKKANINDIAYIAAHTLLPHLLAMPKEWLFVPADLEAAENKRQCRRHPRRRRRPRRHQRMQVEQHRREMNVASNLAGLINKNNPAHSQNIPPYGRACMSAGSFIPLPLAWCRFTLSCPAEFAPGGLRHAGPAGR